MEEVFVNGDRIDYFMHRKLPFPFTSREFLISHHFIENLHGFSIDLGFSIKRPDTPPHPKRVRGEMCKIIFFCNVLLVHAGCCAENPENPNQVKVVNIVKIDMKGSIPVWVMNVAGVEHLKIMKKGMKAHVRFATEHKLYEKYGYQPPKSK